MNKKELSAREDFRERVRNDPFGRFLGIKVDEVEPGYARAHLRVRKEFQNFSGYIHGGLIFSLADQAFAAASNSWERLALGLQMGINYLSPPVIGDDLTAEAHQIHSGKKISVYRIEVKNSSGRLMADCQGTVYQKTRGA